MSFLVVVVVPAISVKGYLMTVIFLMSLKAKIFFEFFSLVLIHRNEDHVYARRHRNPQGRFHHTVDRWWAHSPGDCVCPHHTSQWWKAMATKVRTPWDKFRAKKAGWKRERGRDFSGGDWTGTEGGGQSWIGFREGGNTTCTAHVAGESVSPWLNNWELSYILE